jgi:hypothetical protein
MRAQWWMVGLATVGLTVGAARCSPQREATLVRHPVPAREGLMNLRADGGPPVRRGIPLKPSTDQKKPPCDAELGEEALHAACYVPVAGRKPPCGKLLEEGQRCFRAVFVAPRQPTSVGR